MKHKQYENWILDDAPLSDAQQHELDTHLEVCKNCQLLLRGWVASKQLITQSTMQTPTLGFTDRWQKTRIRKCQIEKLRRHRLTLFGLVLLTFVSSIIYILVSGSFMQMFANVFTMVLEIVVGITNGLSTIGYWLSRLPIAVPITAGFIYFGLLSSFVIVGIFFLWNLNQRKLQTNEISEN